MIWGKVSVQPAPAPSETVTVPVGGKGPVTSGTTLITTLYACPTELGSGLSETIFVVVLVFAGVGVGVSVGIGEGLVVGLGVGVGTAEPHTFLEDAVFRGAAVAVCKSAPLSPLSVQPPPFRKRAVVVPGAAAAELPSQQFADP